MVVRVYPLRGEGIKPSPIHTIFYYKVITMKVYEKNGEFGEYQSTENYSVLSLSTHSCAHSTQEVDLDK